VTFCIFGHHTLYSIKICITQPIGLLQYDIPNDSMFCNSQIPSISEVSIRTDHPVLQKMKPACMHGYHGKIIVSLIIHLQESMKLHSDQSHLRDDVCYTIPCFGGSVSSLPLTCLGHIQFERKYRIPNRFTINNAFPRINNTTEQNNLLSVAQTNSARI
jgi:hypothetical protein